MKPWAIALAIFFSLSANAKVGSEAVLGELKSGRRFEVLENLAVAIPPLLRLLGEMPPLQVTENSIRLSVAQATADPVCLVTGLHLGAGIPDEFRLSKGSMIEVSSVQFAKKAHANYAGPAVAFSAQAKGTQVKAKFQCFPGKGSKSTMPVEVFERLFRRKVRLLSER